MDSKTLIKALKTAVREVIKEELTEILREGLQSTINEMTSTKTTNVATQTKPVTQTKNKVQFNENKWASVLNQTDSLREQSSVGSFAQMMNEEMETLSFSSRDAAGFGAVRQNSMPRTAAPQIMEDPETGKNLQVDPIVAKAMTRDYSALMKAIDKKKGK
jgi:hypothetical protein